jgi:hypothetical protein
MWSLTGRLVTGLATAVLAGGLVTLSAQQVSAGTDATTADATPAGGREVVGEPLSPLSPTVPRAGDGSRRGTDDWRIRRPAAGRIAAYTTAISAPAGTRVGLKVSTRARGYRVSAYRIGSYRGGTGALVWRSGFLAGEEQAEPVLDPVETRTVVAPWHESLVLDTTGWEPGFYVLKLRTGSGWETAAPYVVSSPAATGTVALVAPVATWQAYNRWGGYSLYDGAGGDRRSWAVSYDRPFNLATGANDYRTAAIPVIVRAERLRQLSGIRLSYFTDVDLDQDPDLLEGARGYVSMGHDEYWTPAMRHAVEQARDGGTNLAFLGANTMYWRIRLQDRSTGPARLEVGYRSDASLDPERDERPAEATSRFRDPPAPESEQGLVGMEYECYPVEADYVVTSPTWFGFAGTGVHLGDRFAGLVGPEADRVYLDARTPRPMEVLSHTSYSCRGVLTTAQSVYYTTPSGAGVFTAGTLRWGCAVVDRCEHPLGDRTRDFVRKVTDTLLRAYAAGPVGRTEPARDTVSQYPLPDVNSVEAS